MIVVGNEATRACNTDQLCNGLEAGIEGEGGYHVRTLLEAYELDEERWRILLFDAPNNFNEGNLKVTVWVVRHV